MEVQYATSIFTLLVSISNYRRMYEVSRPRITLPWMAIESHYLNVLIKMRIQSHSLIYNAYLVYLLYHSETFIGTQFES